MPGPVVRKGSAGLNMHEALWRRWQLQGRECHGRGGTLGEKGEEREVGNRVEVTAQLATWTGLERGHADRESTEEGLIQGAMGGGA